MGKRMRTGSRAGQPCTLGAGSRGFTYIGALIIVAIIGVGLGAIGPVAHTLQMRDKERELLFIGDEFRRAIALYYEGSPGGLKQYPRTLEDLLRDTRYASVRRHLRKIYADPMTGKREWGLVEASGVGITGVYSLSQEPPLKKANFPARHQSFATAEKYSDWKFAYVPASAKSTPAGPQRAPPSPPQTGQVLTR